MIKELGLEIEHLERPAGDRAGGGEHRPRPARPVTDPKALIIVRDGLIVRVGKRKIARVRLV